jgi:SNF2-related domain
MRRSYTYYLPKIYKARNLPDDVDPDVLVQVLTIQTYKSFEAPLYSATIRDNYLKITPVIPGVAEQVEGLMAFAGTNYIYGSGKGLRASVDSDTSNLFVHIWIHMPELLDMVNTGQPIAFRDLLASAFDVRLTASRSINFPSCLLEHGVRTADISIFNNNMKLPLPGTLVAQLDHAGEKLRTPLWTTQKQFVTRAIRIEEEGLDITYIKQGFLRVANASGDVIFYDRSHRALLLAEEAENVMMSVNVRGGFLVDDVGLGKTLAIIALCLLRPAPPDFIAGESGMLRRMADGRVASRATLVICPAQVVAHWQAQIYDYSTQPQPRVIVVATKRDYDNLSFHNVANADFVIMSFNFIGNAAFRANFEDFGPDGWTHFPERVRTALHETKRQCTASYAFLAPGCRRVP